MTNDEIDAIARHYSNRPQGDLTWEAVG